MEKDIAEAFREIIAGIQSLQKEIKEIDGAGETFVYDSKVGLNNKKLFEKILEKAKKKKSPVIKRWVLLAEKEVISQNEKKRKILLDLIFQFAQMTEKVREIRILQQEKRLVESVFQK